MTPLIVMIFLFFIIQLNININTLLDNDSNIEQFKTTNNETETDEEIIEILIPNTTINYKVMKYTDNDYYLNHDIEGNINNRGAIFKDYRSVGYKNLIIYGHSIFNSNEMFSELQRYKNKSELSKIDNIVVKINDNSYNYKIFAVATVNISTFDLSYQQDLNKQEMKFYVEFIKSKSYYYVDTPDEDFNLLTLYTCDLDYDIGSDYRILIFAYSPIIK